MLGHLWELPVTTGGSQKAFQEQLIQLIPCKFDWNLKCEESFKKLKTLLTTAPILRIADPNKDFVVCTDACNDGLGVILTQYGHVIAYESRKLKIHENNYITYDLELAAIIHALKMWRHHLIGRKFT